MKNNLILLVLLIAAGMVGAAFDSFTKPNIVYKLNHNITFDEDSCKSTFDNLTGQPDGWHAVSKEDSLYISNFMNDKSTCKDFYNLFTKE